MTSPQELLQSLLPFANSLQKAVAQGIKVGGEPNHNLPAVYRDIKRVFKYPKEVFPKMYVAQIVMNLLDTRYNCSENEFGWQRMTKIVKKTSGAKMIMALQTVEQGQLNPQIMTIVDALVDFLRQTDVKAILTSVASETSPNRYGHPLVPFWRAFVRAYAPELVPFLP